MHEIILSYLNAGLCIIPIKSNTKEPAIKWKNYQKQLPQTSTIFNWFKNKKFNPALVAGQISGGVLVIDFDNHRGNIKEIFEKYKTIIQQNDPHLWEKLVIQQTPSKGYHIIFRCDNPGKNIKIANCKTENNTETTIIETRGDGGYALVYPSPGYIILQGKLEKIQKINEHEKMLLLSTCKLFDENPARNIIDKNYSAQIEKNRPGDIFNQYYTIDQLKSLLNNWKWFEFENGKYYLTRPGKEKGVSATFNVIPNKLYVFSTNAHPFEPNAAYDPFSIYTLVKHNGDYYKAAKMLAENNFKTFVEKEKSEKPDSKNLIDIIESYIINNYDLRFNIVKNITEFKHKNLFNDSWKTLDERKLNDIWIALRRTHKSMPIQAIQNFLTSNFIENYNPIILFFEMLPDWDGRDHIQDLINIAHPVFEQKHSWEIYFRKWLAACVASAYEVSLNQTCLVLVGQQGIGKTTFIDYLVPKELKQYYFTGSLDPRQKDSKIIVCEYFLINLDELETTTKDEIGLIKSLMTTEIISYRYPYERRTGNYRHRANFIASINRIHFLDDFTGTRRFLPIEIESFDLDKIRSQYIDIYQVWAQAKYLFKNGFQYWFDFNEIQIVLENNKQFEVVAVEQELLEKFFTPYDYFNETPQQLRQMANDGIIQLLTFTEIFDKLQSETNLKLSIKKLAYFLRTLHYPQIHIWDNEKTKRVYVLQQQHLMFQKTKFFSLA